MMGKPTSENNGIEVGDSIENFHEELMKFEDDEEEQGDDDTDKKEV